MMSKIFLDLDGVCCSFVDHALFTHGREEVKITHYDLESQLGLTKKQFQKPINESGAAWWASIPELPWFRKIMDLANHYFDEVYFLSNPANYTGAPEGKKIWIKRRLGKDFNNYIFTKHKHVCARPDAVLVDDDDLNCETFIKEGGLAIPFPQLWSSAKEHCGNEMPYLERQLEDAIKKIRAYEDWKHVNDYEEAGDEEDSDS